MSLVLARFTHAECNHELWWLPERRDVQTTCPTADIKRHLPSCYRSQGGLLEAGGTKRRGGGRALRARKEAIVQARGTTQGKYKVGLHTLSFAHSLSCLLTRSPKTAS